MILQMLYQLFILDLGIDHSVASWAQIDLILSFEHNFALLIHHWLGRLGEKENIGGAVPKVIFGFEVAFYLIFILQAGHDVDLNTFELSGLAINVEFGESGDEEVENGAS